MFKQEFLEEHPEIIDPLNKLSGKITDEEMQDMNYRVTVEDELPNDVAREYLEENNLIE